MSRTQFDLFGGNSDDGELLPPLDPAPENAPTRKTRRTAGESKVQSIAPDEDLAQLARSLPVGAHLGTSSWSFPGWAGLVYADSHSDQMLARKGLAPAAAPQTRNGIRLMPVRSDAKPTPLSEINRLRDELPWA